MKNSMSRGAAALTAVIVLICMIGMTAWLFPVMNLFFQITSIMADVLIAILIVWELIMWGESEEDNPIKYTGPFKFMYINHYLKDEGVKLKGFSIGKIFMWIVFILLAVWIGKLAFIVGGESVFIYNKSKIYTNLYNQKCEERIGFYDKLWKTYLQKEKITNVNKETFITVTKIIMENRKDGEQVMWKWVRENQQIPYEEFTKFYSDLSTFIANQREGYFNLEKECLLLSRQHNVLLDTFPHNIYNKILKLKKIKFEYGFTSDSTNDVFKSKIENIK